MHVLYILTYYCIVDGRITDTDQPSNRKSAPSKVLLCHEKEKKDKYGALCIARRRTFTPLVFSIDGLLGKEATAASKRLATSLASKWKRSYSEVCGYSLPTLDCPDSLLQSMPQSGTHSYPPIPHTHVGFRYRVRTLSDVTIHYHHRTFEILHTHIRVIFTPFYFQKGLTLHIFYTTVTSVDNSI
jgi:hypothetical protein